jgi:hypothetical protein
MFNKTISLMSVQERNELIEGYFKRLTGSDIIMYRTVNNYASAVREDTEGSIYWKASMKKEFWRKDMPPAKIESLSVLTGLIGEDEQPNVFTNIDLCYAWKGTPSVKERIEKSLNAQKTIRNILKEKGHDYRNLIFMAPAEETTLRNVGRGNDISNVCVNIDSGHVRLVLAEKIGMISENNEVKISTYSDDRREEVLPCLNLQIEMLERSLQNK